MDKAPPAALLALALALSPAAAEAEDFSLYVSPGFLYSRSWSVYDGPEFGVELSVPFRFGDFGQGSHWPFAVGPLTQWQKHAQAQRLMVGGELVTLGGGAEIGLATRWDDERTSHGLHLSVYASAALLNIGPRFVWWGAYGVETGLALTFKIPVIVYGLDILGPFTGGRPWRGRAPLLLRGSLSRGRRPPVEMSRPLREALARAWLKDACDELISVATFESLAEDLLRHGAPASLVLRARRAAREEKAHGARCLEVFGALTGVSVRMEVARPRSQSHATLGELAEHSARDGVVGEGAAANALAERAAQALPVIRDHLRQIAREERGHADLAHDIVRWTAQRGVPIPKLPAGGAFAAHEDTWSSRSIARAWGRA